jgi:hypothetical protein
MASSSVPVSAKRIAVFTFREALYGTASEKRISPGDGVHKEDLFAPCLHVLPEIFDVEVKGMKVCDTRIR